jgi:hypothetical protein
MITWHIEKRKVADLIEYEGNPRDLTEKGLKDLKASIKKFGCAEPPAINTDNVICGGHGRKKVLVDMGVVEVDCMVPDRTLTPDEMRELNIRLNKNIAGKWNFDILSSDYEVKELVDFGFEEWELGLGGEEQAVDIDTETEKQDEEITCPNCNFKFKNDKNIFNEIESISK